VGQDPPNSRVIQTTYNLFRVLEFEDSNQNYGDIRQTGSLPLVFYSLCPSSRPAVIPVTITKICSCASNETGGGRELPTEAVGNPRSS